MNNKENKKALLKKVAKQTRISYETCLKVTDALMLQIMKDVSDGINVNLKGFALFTSREIDKLNGKVCNTNEDFELDKPFRSPVIKTAKKFRYIVRYGFMEDDYLDDLSLFDEEEDYFNE